MSRFQWIFSDPHFGHKTLSRKGWRPFDSEQEMADTLVRNYSDKVLDGDSVLWLGDAFFCNRVDARGILSVLPGRKTLVLGNHDGSPARMRWIGFEEVHETLCFQDDGYSFRACHYPYEGEGREGDERYKERMPPRVSGEILLHGHTHAKQRYGISSIHCGVDAWSWCPVPWSKIMEYVGSKRVLPND